jgi:hypothetical protein
MVINCPICHAHSSVNTPWGGRSRDGTQIFVLQCINCSGMLFAEQDETNPQRPKLLYPVEREESPPEYPDDVRDNYTEAVRSLKAGNFKACIVMTRGSLQAAMRDKQAKGNNLKQEIEDLASRHIIPDSLKEWSHEIRDGGNLVAHPEPNKRVTKADAEELLALAESIFQYLYVVPAQVEARRQRLQQSP